MELAEFLQDGDIEVEYYEGTWKAWKALTRIGIYQADDNIVRELFVKFSEFVSSLTLVMSRYQVELGRKKLEADNTLAYLLSVEYPAGAVNQRNIDAKSNTKYTGALLKEQEAEGNLILVKAMVNACQIVADSLSRELSYRIKTN